MNGHMLKHEQDSDAWLGTCKSCSRQTLLHLEEMPRGLWSSAPVLRPCESTDASGVLLSLPKPVTVTWCPCWLFMMPSKSETPAYTVLSDDRRHDAEV